METIKISQESLDAFKNEKKLIPAPLDNKNVTTDWIEEIFDFQTCIYGKKMAVGFIADEPVIAAWTVNTIIWSFPSLVMTCIDGTKPLEELRKRLSVYDDANTELKHEYCVIGNLLMQKFYWNKD